MDRPSAYRAARRLAGVCLFLLAGCATGSNSLSLFPERQELIDTAKTVRQNAPAPLARELDKRPIEAYIVEPGDGLLVLPADIDSPVRLPSDQTVLPDGTIDLGKYGRPRVAGMTVPDIEALVNKLVTEKARSDKKEKDEPPPGFIQVRLVGRVSKVYYVLGEVNTPGSFPLQGRETVLDGIVAAGGLNSRASRKNIILVRPSNPEECRLVLGVCYPEIVQLGDTSTNYQLRPGDRIFVASKGLLEGFHERKKPCATCTGPHAPCDVGAACGAPASLARPAGLPPATVIAPAPSAGVGPATPLP